MEINLKLIRKTFSNIATIGDLNSNNNFFCYTLEDFDRDLNRDGDLKDPGEIKVNGKTAIPRGKYDVIINMSNRFGRMMPLLLNVPGFEGVRIHNGNKAEHTEGCILVGSSKANNFIGNSKPTFEKLMKILQDPKVTKITIEIV